MGVYDDINALGEVVTEEAAKGAARDLAIKTLAQMMSELIGTQFAEIVDDRASFMESDDDEEGREVRQNGGSLSIFARSR